jgi:hypothetical protein
MFSPVYVATVDDGLRIAFAWLCFYFAVPLFYLMVKMFRDGTKV